MGAFSAHNNHLLQPSEQVFAKPAIPPSYVFGCVCVCVLHVCVCACCMLCIFLCADMKERGGHWCLVSFSNLYT